MTNRELLEQIIHDMTDDELASAICFNDFRNIAETDSDIEGRTPKEKILDWLKREAQPN